MTYGKKVRTRVKITGWIMAATLGGIGAILTFPITYWLCGISPTKIADTCLDNSDMLARQLRYSS